jgi:uncharacterized membrane protein YbhN (UPF0104 family)
MLAKSNNKYVIARRLLPALLIVIAAYVIVPQLHVFRESLGHLHNLYYGQLILALSMVALTFICAAAVYRQLAFKRISYGRTLIAQVAANFINRLLPAGIGGIGTNYRYLRKQKHTAAQAAAVVTANNSLGLVGHGLLIIILTAIFHAHAVPVHIATKFWYSLIVVMIFIILAAAILPQIRRRITKNIRSFSAQLRSFRTRPLAVGCALGLQVCLTLSNVTAFWLCVLAVHVSISFVAALLIFTFGFGVGGATPTPGGLGGVEAGLVAGLVTYHIASPVALAAVLVYRLVSYWLPLLVSAPVFMYATRRHYFD